MSRFKRVFLGDKAFYKGVLAIMIPVIIQNSVTNFVNLLDNIMVGQLGTGQMSGVAIANQLIFVFNLCIFGGLSGPGIFGAQYFGAGDMEGLRNTFRIKVWFSTLITIIATAVIVIWQSPLIQLFLQGEGSQEVAQDMLAYAREYLYYMIPGFLPFAMAMSYGSTIRETGDSVLPMKAGIVSVLTNLLGNWLLIFGNLGFPAWGVKGAAVATVFSRVVELAILAYNAHNTVRFSFFKKIYRSMKVPAQLLSAIIKKSLPLLVNELLWSLGMVTLTQSYSTRGLLVLAALNISSTVTNLFNVFFYGVGNAVAVLVGHSLGSGKLKKAREDVWKLMFLGFVMCIGIGGILAAFAGVFPNFYQVEQESRNMAATFILISAALMPFHALAHSAYFTLRSGGSTFITFLFDSAFTWVILIPFTRALAFMTGMPIVPLYLLSQATVIIKTVIGLLLVYSGRWQRNIVKTADA
ncbi:MAG: MATE family efflux transporter [Clostridiales bacterium]|nr:MATE family efflux transporter [Clostridiales bacterium]